MLVSYRENEVRINTERVVPVKQDVGSTGNPNMYYVTFRAYAPEGATGVIESDGTQTDTEPTVLATDVYGRKYATIWSAIASFNGTTWTKWGDNSTLDKYLGFYYTFKWFKEDQLISTDKVRVILTNDACHDDLVPDAVARRIDEKVKAIEIPEYDLSGYALKSEIPSVDGLASETYVQEEIAKIEIPEVDLSDYAKLSDIPSHDGLATETYVLAEIAKAQLEEGEVDLSGYATKDDIASFASTEYVNEKIAGIEIPEVPVNVSAFTNDAGYLTEHQSLEGFATEEFVTEAVAAVEIPSIEGLASEEFVNDAIAAIELPEAEIYKVDFNAPNFAEATKAYKAGKVLVLVNAAPDTNSYALMNYVSDSYITFTKFLTNRSETYGAFNTYYLSADNTWEVSKEVKISKVEANIDGDVVGQLNTIKINKEIYSIPSIDGLASEAYVDEKFNAIEIPEVDLSEYALKSELFSKDYNELVNTPEIPSIVGLATESYVDEKFSSIPEVDLAGYATEEFVGAEIAKISIPEVDGFATKEELAEAINSIEHPVTDLTNYVKKDEIAEFIKEVPSEYITESELEAKGYLTEHQSLEGYATEQFVEEALAEIDIPEVPTNVSAFTNDAGYLTEHQDLSDYAKRDELPSTEGLATEEFVAEAIADIEFPETDLTNYYTKEETDAAVVVKANDVPFTTTKIVNRAIGGFTIGEDINGLTIAELFAKLLELSDGTDPEEPEIPEEPDSPIEAAKKLAMYSVTMENELAAVSDTSITTMTVAEAALAPNKSGFYQIVDDSGEVIESGYQDLTISSEDTYYVIALPKVIDYNTMVEMQAYDADDAKWYPADKLPLISDPDTVLALCDEVGVDISHIDTNLYTVWVLEDICTGSQLRYIIKEA